MAGETRITVVGNIGGEVDLRFTPSGAAVANFSVCSTPRTYDKQTNEWRDGDPMWLRCSAWRQMAENVAETLEKGMRVIVVGNLKARSYETREGEKRTSWEIDVDEVGPSLKMATARVQRASRDSSTAQSSAGGWGGTQPDPWATPAGAPTGGGGWSGGGGAQHDEPPF